MARIAGVELPVGKRIDVGLTYILGLVRPVREILFTKDRSGSGNEVKDLHEDEVVRLRETIDKDYDVEGDLERVTMSIAFDGCGTYRGLRHRKGLPVRGKGRNKFNEKGRRGAIGGKVRK